MATEPKPGMRPRPSMGPPVKHKVEDLPALLEAALPDPEPVLEVLVSAAAKGQDVAAVWNMLHAAAVRHDKVSELAFAYEHLSQGKRLKLLGPEIQAQVYLYAVRFFSETFGDPDGAVAYAERALAIVPGHPQAFAALESLLVDSGQPLRLAKLYVDAAASERARDQQIMLLGRAAELVEGQPESDELAIDLYQRLIKADPRAAAARRSLEQRLMAVGRTRDAVRVLEQALALDPPIEETEAQGLRERLLEIYSRELAEPKNAISHVEALIARDPRHVEARKLAEALLENKAVAPRAIAALSDAYEKLGELPAAAAMLAQELKIVRGPRRIDVQRRLGILRQDVLNDPTGALELLAPVVAGDPGDDALRRRFVELSESLGQPLEAARLLNRALGTAKEASIKARVCAEIGAVFARAGDPKAAQASFQQVLEIGQDDSATLQAARHLAELYAEAQDLEGLYRALDLVVQHETERDARQAAARRLARLCEGELNDPDRAVSAYRALIGSPWTDDALRKLEQLFEKSGDVEGLVDVLERRAERTRDANEARELVFRAAELRSTKSRDPQAALGAWRGLAEKYGASREINARLIPLLEQAGQWEELVRVLEHDVEFADGPEQRAAVLGRVAHLRLVRLRDAPLALASFRQALAIDPREPISRAAVEKLLASKEHKLGAAEILEPVYRREGEAVGLVRVLEVRAELETDSVRRLRAITEAVGIAEQKLADPARALELAGQALSIAARSERGLVAEWLARVQTLGGTSGDPTARARVLAAALGDKEVDSPELATFARAAGDALVACGDIAAAIDAYRGALSFEPSPELMRRIDELLAQQGSPGERLALYRTAFERETDRTRRRELLHAMAALQRRDLHDPAGALETWRRVLEEDPRDLTAHQALVDAYQESKDWESIYAELHRALAHLDGERHMVTLLRMAEVSAEHGQPLRALTHYRELMAASELADDVLEAIEELARSHDDAATTRAVLERRVLSTTSAEQRASLLERLGNVLAWQLDDAPAAALVWLEGARVSETEAVDAARARRLYERVLGALPEHREAAERLLDLYVKANEWDAMGEPFEALLRAAPTVAVPFVLELEARATESGAQAPLVALLDAALASRPGAAPARRLLLAKARALGKLPERHDDAGHVYRALLESSDEDESEIASAFEAFLAANSEGEPRIDDRRWLFSWRTEKNPESPGAWLAWAAAEESEFGDRAAAARLYERALALDPERTEALTQLARLRVEQGDAQGALDNLLALRDQSVGEARTAAERAMAILLMEQLGRPADALQVVEPLLEASPADPDALRVVHAALGHEATRARAAELLDRASEATEDPAARAQVLEALLSVTAASADLGVARARWFKRLLECRPDDAEASLAIALRAAAERVADDELWAWAERLARKLDRPAPLAEAYEAALTHELTAEQAEMLGRRVIEFYEEWFDRPDRVIELLERVLGSSPNAGWAFDRLKLAFNAAGRWSELFGLYDRALASDGLADPVRVELLREAAMAAKDFAGEGERAIGYLEQLDRLVPDDSRIENALERLYERHTRARPLIGLLERRMRTATGDARQELRRRSASLWLELGEALPTFALVEAMLEEAPDAPEGIKLLAQLLELPVSRNSIPAPPPDRADDGEHERKASVRDLAAAVLKRHYQATGRTADVVRMIEIEAEVATTLEERVARLGTIVDMRLGELDDPEGGFATLSELVRLEPAVLEHRARLAEVADRIGGERRRAELLAGVAEALAEPGLRAALLIEAAGVENTKLADPERAIGHYLEALALHPNAGQAALEAARALDSLLESAGRALERASVLESLAELESEPQSRRRALVEAARVTMRLSDPERAIRSWHACLAVDDRDLEALDGLCEALETAERWDELVSALERRATLGADRDRAYRDRVLVARLHDDKRSDPGMAIDAWRRVREAFGADKSSFEALGGLYEKTERWEELAAHLADEAEREPGGERRSELYRELGRILNTKIGDPLRALNAFVWADDWQRAIEVAGAGGRDPAHGLAVCRSLLDVAVDAWRRKPEGSSGPETAASWAVDEIAARLREQGQHAELVELLLRGSGLPFAPRRSRELRREAACVYSDRLDDARRAISTFQELFNDDPGDDVAAASVTRLALLLEEQGLDGELVSLWEGQALSRAHAGDPAAAAALWARAAELAETRLGDLERAIADYREGAGLGGEISLESLARLYEARGDSRQAAEALEWLCAQSSRDALAERALRLAEAHLASGERRRARARLEQAAATAIDTAALRRRLAELYREGQEWAPLAELLAVDAQRAPDTKSRLSLLREAASLHVERRDDPSSAVPLLEQAVDTDPDDPAHRLALADALRRAERLDEAAATLRTQIERYGSRRPKDRALVHLALARVALAAQNRAEALGELDLATKIDPAHAGILELLARLAFEEGQLDRAERMYRSLLLVLGREDTPEGPSRAEALLDLSEIAAQREDPSRAGEFVESAFEAALDSEREADSLENALRRRGRMELLGRALEARLRTATDPSRAARALADLVFLQSAAGQSAPSVREQALAIQRKLETEGASDDAAWIALGRVYDWLGDAEAEASVLERRVDALGAAAEGADAAEAFYKLARIRLGDERTRDRGLELLERALEIHTDAARASDILRGSLGAEPADERGVRLLERVARATGDERALAGALALRTRLPGGSDPRVLREAVELGRRLGDLELVESVLRLGMREDSGLTGETAAWVRFELAKLRAEAGELGEALDLREQAASKLPPDQGRVALLEVARSASSELDDYERAARLYEALRAREPADREVWEPLLEVYRRKSDSKRLIELIEATVPLVDTAADRSRLRLEEATVLLEEPGKAETAATLLREILEEDPTQRGAAMLLSGILEQAGRYDDLAALLSSQLDAAKDRGDVESVVSMSLRLGALLEQQERPTGALDAYRASLDWDARNPAALEAVLRLSEAGGDPFQIADALEALLEAGGGEEPEKLAWRLVEMRGEHSNPDGVERALRFGFDAAPTSVALCEALLERYTGRGEWTSAARTLRRAMKANPNDRQLVHRMVEAHRAADEQEPALDIVDALIARTPEDAMLYRERAALLADLTRDDEALDDLERAYALGREQPAQLVEALERAIARAEPPEDGRLTLRLGRVLEETGDLEGARARLAELVKQSPKDREALHRLAAIEERSENWVAASSIHRHLVALEEGPELVRAALDLADACERSGRLGDARGGLERALAVDARSAELRRRLRAVYAATGATRELGRMLLDDADAESDVRARLGYLLEAGELFISAEGGLAEAVRILEQARSLSPDSVEGAVLLARAYAAAERADDAITLLGEVVASHRGRRSKALAVVYHEISSIKLGQGFLSEALDALTKAFEMDVRNGQLAMQLGQLALDIDEEETAVRAFRSVTMMKPADADSAEGATSESKAEAHFQLARVASKQGDARKAKVLVTKALAENPELDSARVLLLDLEAAERRA